MAESAEQDPNLPLEADDFEDGDSAFGAGSDTTSAISSIFKYRVENGRTYHSYKSDCSFVHRCVQEFVVCIALLTEYVLFVQHDHTICQTMRYLT